MKTLKIYSITIKTRLNSVFANKGKTLYITYQSAYDQKEAREKERQERIKARRNKRDMER